MFADFRKKNPNFSFSYYLYREVVSSLGISFAKLGNEECWQCEKFLLHEKTSGHKKDSVVSNNYFDDCGDCKTFYTHWKKYTEARLRYKHDSENQDADNLVVSADLEKVNIYFSILINV